MNKKLVWMSVLALTGAALAGNYTTWGNYRNLTLSTTGITAGALTKVPVLVRFSDASQANMFSTTSAALANGADLRFTKADGTTDLPFEINDWTAGAGGSGSVWVLLDSVKANKDTAATFRVYWRKSGSTTASSPANTFATANGYQAVFHLNEDTGSVKDAARGYTATATGTASAVGLGLMGNARTFASSASGTADETAATNYLTFTPGASDPLSTLTGPVSMEAWVSASITNNSNTSTGTKQIISHGTGGGTESAWLKRTGGTGQAYAAGGTAANLNGPLVPTGEANTWHYIVATWDGTSWTVYRERVSDPWATPSGTVTTGTLTGSVTTVGGGAPVASSNPWFIGAWSADGLGGAMSRPWYGSLDEVRISNVARDSNYVRLNFETQKTGATAVTVGNNVTVAILPRATARAEGLQVRSTSGLVTFTLPSDAKGARASILDLSGREVWSRTAARGEREIAWTGAPASGVYIARLSVLGAGDRFVPAGETTVTLAP